MIEEQFVEALLARARRFVSACDEFWPEYPEGIGEEMGALIDIAQPETGIWLRVPVKDRSRKRKMEPAWRCSGCRRLYYSATEPAPCNNCTSSWGEEEEE